MDNTCRLHNCNVCNKSYSSYKSLWNHNKKFHIKESSFVGLQNQNVILLHTINCKFCKKIFNNRQNKYRHEKICKLKDNIVLELQQKNKEFENKIIELETKINTKSNKIIKTQNNNNNTTNNNNNGTINNITINQFGKENINALSIKEIKELIKNDNYLIDIVKLLNFNEKFPENHSFCNTSLEGKYISVFNSNSNKIEKINKNDFYDKVLCNSFDKMDNLSLILELNNDVKEQIKVKYREHLDNKLTHIKDIFYKDKLYKNNYKTNINELAYNKNKIVLDTWSSVPEIEKSLDESDTEESVNSKYSAFTSDSE